MPAGPSDDKRKIRPDTFRGHPACLYHTFPFYRIKAWNYRKGSDF